MMPVLRGLLTQATTDYVDARGYRTPVPNLVREAHEVGIGDRPMPSAVRAPVRTEGAEPEIPEDDGPIEIRSTSRDR